MGSSKLIAAVLLPAILSLHAPMTITAANSNLFREYIGAIFNGVQFSDVPINPTVQFDFILAFAIDYTSATDTDPPTPTNGQFNIFWQDSILTPSAVASIKQRNPNARVAVSLGGATVSSSPVLFSATSVDSWVQNAVSSLTGIIREYDLDGVDIDYEQFQADPATFAECVGRLVAALKSSGAIRFASIAPFDDAEVQSHYQALWASYGGVIDYINFQFYAYDASTTADQYVSHFDDQIANYTLEATSWPASARSRRRPRCRLIRRSAPARLCSRRRSSTASSSGLQITLADRGSCTKREHKHCWPMPPASS